MPPIPPPTKCLSYHCDKKMICYTNYQPHYQPNYLLDQIIIGNTTWGYFPNVNKLSETYGYIDHKPFYYLQTTNKSSHELRIKLVIGLNLYIWICGPKAFALKDVEFLLDVNVLLYEEVIYEPTDNRIVWKDIKFPKGFECVELYGLPKGEHVLSIVNNKKYPVAKLSLSHIIFWLSENKNSIV